MSIRILRVDQIEKTITVAGGTGYVDFDEGGRIDGLAITVPAGSPTWDITLKNKAGRLIWAASSNAGTTTLHVDRAAPSGGNRITLSNVSAAGDYIVTLWIERGF